MLGIFFGLFWILWLICIAVMVALFVFWILMLVDVVKRNFPNNNDKLVWVLVIVLAGIIGALVYYFVVKRKDKKKRK
ncbi:PLDc N-terminal domain-containing protein [Candidatus Woesearchaeota archaeon]|nr:PLDc N-terminal domain-containing protein [Candidatus Woesearchaeota archaeon]